MLYVLIEADTEKVLTRAKIKSWDKNWGGYSWTNAPTAKLSSAITKFNSLPAKAQSKVDVAKLIISDERHTAADLALVKAKEDRKKLEKKLTSEKLAHTKKMDKIRKDLEKLDKTLS